MGGSNEIPPSVDRSCRIGIPPNEALNMNRSLYLIIGYLLRNEHEDLKSKFHDWLVKVS